ncbi:MAG TPA: DUF4097 family beta strand repeat-containing protein [Blastocatellia bacterium]|nr:DUF4097 family beta strand repeat-containing protein [Blastocatellia bacterium]
MIGLLLLAVGLIFVFVPAGAGVTEWLMRLWPIFLICAGVVRVMGFAVERKPRSPVGGMLLIIIGVLFLAHRFTSSVNVLSTYGRYWLLLLMVFAAVELVRYYTHRPADGAPPRLFTPWRLVIITLIVVTGVVSNRIASSNPSFLSALKLSGILGGLRDSVIGETYNFTDPVYSSPTFVPGMKVIVNNGYGDVKVTGNAQAIRATLTQGVRAWSQEEARNIAEQIKLVVTQTSDGLTITTNRDQIDQQFTTNIQLEVPSRVALSVTNSYGGVSASGIDGKLAVTANYAQNEINLNRITGDVNCNLTYSDVALSSIAGNVRITGAKSAKVSDVSGSVEVAASNGAVEIRDLSGQVKVNAPFSRIKAQDLQSDAELKTEHASVDVINAVDVIINAPHSSVRAKGITGNLSIYSSQQAIEIRSIAGELKIDSERSSVSGEELRGPVEVKTSHGEVVLKNFFESVDVETSYRDVTLIASEEPVADIEVDNLHGEIKLVLPQSSQFKLDASSQGGHVRPVGFNELPVKARDGLVTMRGLDGPEIKLKTTYKNITIQAGTPSVERARQ